MTNEQKAKEIVKNASYLPNLTEYEAMTFVATEMAKWKDEQHKQELIRIYNFVRPYLTIEAINDLKIIIGIC